MCYFSFHTLIITQKKDLELLRTLGPPLFLGVVFFTAPFFNAIQKEKHNLAPPCDLLYDGVAIIHQERRSNE